MTLTPDDLEHPRDSFWEGNVLSKAKTQDRQIHAQNPMVVRLVGRGD